MRAHHLMNLLSVVYCNAALNTTFLAIVVIVFNSFLPGICKI